MAVELLLATSSVHKLTEMRRLIMAAGLELTVLGLSDVAGYPEPVEDGDSFVDNAIIKAQTGLAASGLPTLADDSGLCVDVLNGMPGVRSARWAGGHGDDQENLDLLLRQIDDVAPNRRGAHYSCAMALAMPGGLEAVEGQIDGRLLMSRRGTGGFGYDPIFVPSSQDLTFAEMTAEQKDAFSHRGRALRAIMPALALLAATASN
ncbi:MAG: RdgB/HAM1 family non-canonical purine NTP pyrophosphatase [Propionibacteriaceae bacterium]|jgi:XTP/dITP diphosphohydrolase|nr:RdgB/HAM1 family non-canonical purine NTP pyrophosphatase [Propionibacteriaceae bacterium]